MDLTSSQARLADLLKQCVEKKTHRAWLRGLGVVCQAFPPMAHVEDYAVLLFGADVPIASKDLALRLLFIVADEASVKHLVECVCRPTQHYHLRTTAVQLLIKLDLQVAREAVEAGAYALMPLIEDEEREPSGAREPLLVTIDELEEEGEVVLAEMPEEDHTRRYRQAFESPLKIGDV